MIKGWKKDEYNNNSNNISQIKVFVEDTVTVCHNHDKQHGFMVKGKSMNHICIINLDWVKCYGSNTFKTVSKMQC